MSAILARILRHGDELAALEPAWWDLWRRVPGATPFQSPAWLMPWWRAFGPGPLFTLAAEREGRLVGLAPFYIEHGSLGIRLLPVGISLSDYHDVLLDPACAAQAWQALIQAAIAAPDPWERWDWEELMPEASALALPWPDGHPVETAAQSACPVLALPAASLEACLPKSKRRKLNLARNRAARHGTVRLERADAESIPDALDHLFRLHGSRWQSQGEAGVLADDPVQRFHRAAAPMLDKAGMLRLYTLAFDGQVVGAYHGLQHRERAYAYLSGFDPAHEFESPGTLIMAHGIAMALDEGAREFHFLRGQEPYKYDWGALDRWNQRRTLFRRLGRDVAA